YFSSSFGTVLCGGRPHGHGAHSATGALARAVQTLLWPSRAVVVAAQLRPGRLQRQRAEVDAGDAGARDRAGRVPSLSAFHHARTMGCRAGLAPAARRHSGTARDRDSRWHELSETGAALGRGGAAVLRRAGQDRELPSRHHRRAVDRRARVVSGGDPVSARPVADRRGPPTDADPIDGSLSGEMAPRAHLAAAGARRRLRVDRGDWRCGIRRCHVAARGTASTPPALCARDLVDADRVSPPSAPGPTPATRGRTGPPPDGATSRRDRSSDERRRDRAPAAPGRVALDPLAQWRAALAARAIRRPARDTGAGLARGPSGPRGLAPLRTGTRRRPQVLLGPSAAGCGAAAPRRIGASTMGDRTAVSGTQVRAGTRSLRRTDLPGMATSCRAHGGRPRLHPTRADAPRRRRADVSGRARHRPGNLHGALVCGQTAIHAVDGTGETQASTTDLTKSN